MKKLFNIPHEFKTIALIGIGLHLLTAIFSTGFYHWDEHFQILEFLSFKLGNTTAADLPWEYEAGMRPWLQPAFLYLTSFLFPVLKGPFIFATLTRLFAGFIGFFGQLAFFNATADRVPQKNQLKYFLLCQFLWFLPNLHIRFSSEGLAGSFYLLGMAILIQGLSPLLMAIFFALSFWLRFQMGFALLIPIAYWLWQSRQNLKRLSLFVFSFIAVLGINILIDSWGYGKFTFAPWNYIYQNVVLGKTAHFGVNPWYDYLKWLITRPIAPIGLLLLVSILLYFKNKPKDLLTWSIIPFFFAHQLIGHKEFRFLFPLVGLLPLLIITSWERLKLDKKYITIPLCAINLMALLFFAFKPANTLIGFYQSLKQNNVSEINLSSERNPFYPAGLKMSFYISKDLVENTSSSFLYVDKLEKAFSSNCKILSSSIPFISILNSNQLIRPNKNGHFLLRCQ